jgi:hypothetical protein
VLPAFHALYPLPHEQLLLIDLDARDRAPVIASEHDAVDRLRAGDAIDAGDVLKNVEFH